MALLAVKGLEAAALPPLLEQQQQQQQQQQQHLGRRVAGGDDSSTPRCSAGEPLEAAASQAGATAEGGSDGSGGRITAAEAHSFSTAAAMSGNAREAGGVEEEGGGSRFGISPASWTKAVGLPFVDTAVPGDVTDAVLPGASGSAARIVIQSEPDGPCKAGPRDGNGEEGSAVPTSGAGGGGSSALAAPTAVGSSKEEVAEAGAYGPAADRQQAAGGRAEGGHGVRGMRMAVDPQDFMPLVALPALSLPRLPGTAHRRSSGSE